MYVYIDAPYYNVIVSILFSILRIFGHLTPIEAGSRLRPNSRVRILQTDIRSRFRHAGIGRLLECLVLPRLHTIRMDGLSLRHSWRMLLSMGTCSKLHLAATG